MVNPYESPQDDPTAGKWPPPLPQVSRTDVIIWLVMMSLMTAVVWLAGREYEAWMRMLEIKR